MNSKGEFKSAWELLYLIGCPRCRAVYSKKLIKCPECHAPNPLYKEDLEEVERVIETYQNWRMHLGAEGGDGRMWKEPRGRLATSLSAPDER